MDVWCPTRRGRCGLVVDYAVGVDIGGTKIAGALVDSSGAVRRQTVCLTPAGGGEQVVGAVEGLVRQLQVGLDPQVARRLLGVGVGTGGSVEAATGRIVGATRLIANWEGVELQQRLQQVLGMPVRVDNDAKAAARAELLWGAARTARAAVVLTLGTGVGGALTIDGRVLDGARGFAGHLGHIPVRPGGRQCSCGRRGCLEAYASGRAILLAGRKRWLQSRGSAPSQPRAPTEDPHAQTAEAALPDATAVWKAARQGAGWAASVIEEALTALSVALQGLVHAFNPDTIVIGGGLSAWGEPLREAVEEKLRRRILPAFREGLTVRLAALGPQAGVVGAAALLFQAAGVLSHAGTSAGSP